MNDTIYLIANKHGVQRMAHNLDGIFHPGERAFPVSVYISNSAFQPAAIPELKLIVREEDLLTPAVELTVGTTKAEPV
jgi:hypothetical protein